MPTITIGAKVVGQKRPLFTDYCFPLLPDVMALPR